MHSALIAGHMDTGEQADAGQLLKQKRKRRQRSLEEALRSCCDSTAACDANAGAAGCIGSFTLSTLSLTLGTVTT